MAVDITIPSPGESVTEVVLGPWSKSSGDWVERDESLVEIESDKVTLEVPAPESGVLSISAEEGAELSVGDVIGSIDPDAERPSGGSSSGEADAAAAESKSASGSGDGSSSKQSASTDTADSSKDGGAAKASGSGGDGRDEDSNRGTGANGEARATSMARKLAAERGVDLGGIEGTGPGGRVRKQDVLSASDRAAGAEATDNGAAGGASESGSRGVRRAKMSKLRRRIAQRLVSAQQTAAMLTTFNEVDLTEVMQIRKSYKESFEQAHGVGLGFMSFFVKACVSALRAYPSVNAYIDGDEVEYHDYCDVSIAVGTPKGLVVPVLRNAERMSFAEIESGIKDLATRARDGKLTMDDMTGGTFTISNGGVYGSLNSTPILNPPQSGILGMHTIQSRPVEYPRKSGQIALRPMMYLALSYDHRLVDGEGAVSFLVHVKERLEEPEKMLLGL